MNSNLSELNYKGYRERWKGFLFILLIIFSNHFEALKIRNHTWQEKSTNEAEMTSALAGCSSLWPTEYHSFSLLALNVQGLASQGGARSLCISVGITCVFRISLSPLLSIL